MRAFLLGASALALALTGPVLAQGKGGGNGGGGGQKAERGGGGPKADRGGSGSGPKAERGGGGPQADRRGGRGPQTRNRGPQEARQQERRDARGNGSNRDRQVARAERPGRPERVRGPERREVRASEPQGQRKAQRQTHVDDRREGGRQIEQAIRTDRRTRNNNPVYASNERGFVYDIGCPPGLAAKNNGCVPPGQAKKLVGQRAPQVLLTSLLPVAYRSWYPDTADHYYRTEDDYIYRIDRSDNEVLGYAPLYAYGADHQPDYFYPGEAYPLDYVSYYNVPAQYQSYYQDEGEWLYRYGDGGIYRVNQSSGLVDSMVALLAGDLAMGQPLPAGYDVYNVPYAYRDRYQDDAENWYRYNDGHIYQVDAKTQLITAIIQALT
jgi:hypothetical protein